MSTPPVKYHISKKGNPARCKAKIRCPHGEDAPHFPSREKALAYIEEQEASKAQAAGTSIASVKKASKAPSPPPAAPQLSQEDARRVSEYIQRNNVWAGGRAHQEREALRDSLVQSHLIARHLEGAWGKEVSSKNGGQELHVAMPGTNVSAVLTSYKTGTRLTVKDTSAANQKGVSWNLPPDATVEDVTALVEDERQRIIDLQERAREASAKKVDPEREAQRREVTRVLGLLPKGPRPTGYKVTPSESSYPYDTCTECGSIDHEAEEGYSSCCNEPTQFITAKTYHEYRFPTIEAAHTFTEENNMPNVVITAKGPGKVDVVFSPELNDPRERRGSSMGFF